MRREGRGGLVWETNLVGDDTFGLAVGVGVSGGEEGERERTDVKYLRQAQTVPGGAQEEGWAEEL